MQVILPVTPSTRTFLSSRIVFLLTTFSLTLVTYRFPHSWHLTQHSLFPYFCCPLAEMWSLVLQPSREAEFSMHLHFLLMLLPNSKYVCLFLFLFFTSVNTTPKTARYMKTGTILLMAESYDSSALLRI